MHEAWRIVAERAGAEPPKPIEWAVTRDVKPKDIRCDLCGKQADTIHFLPWVAGPRECQQVAFACPGHVPEEQGYMVTVADWFAPAKRSRKGHAIPTTPEHIEQKINGDVALGRLDDRFREIRRKLAA